MSDTSPSSTLARRDRIAILFGLVGASLLAWAYLISMALQMGAEMGGQMAGGSGMMRMRAWSPVDFWLMFLMWAVMMVGMMVPTAMPMALVYAAVARKAKQQGGAVAPTFVFVGGYLFMWTLFSLVATFAQWGLESAALLSPMMVSTSPGLGAALLIGAGVYQLTPAKRACLEHCRAPAYFISQHWHPGLSGAFRMGVVHGVFCLGCCWILMGLLFFGGVMSLLWIAGITAFVLLEKLLPPGFWAERFAGGALIVVGAVLLVEAMGLVG